MHLGQFCSTCEKVRNLNLIEKTKPADKHTKSRRSARGSQLFGMVHQGEGHEFVTKSYQSHQGCS